MDQAHEEGANLPGARKRRNGANGMSDKREPIRGNRSGVRAYYRHETSDCGREESKK